MMDFWYDVITSEKIKIDFQEIFDEVRKQNPDETSISEIDNEFCDNIVYYLQKLYKCPDLIEEDNEYPILHLIDKWQDWLEEKYGKNWWKDTEVSEEELYEL